MCGGAGAVAACLKSDPESGTFSTAPVKISSISSGSLCWDLGDRGVLIIRGRIRPSTTELVAADGMSSSFSFTLKHEHSSGCGIDLGESYILTGGSLGGAAHSKVSSYSPTGWTHDLPNLKIARMKHACSFYTTDNGDNVGFSTSSFFCYFYFKYQILMVTGGYNVGERKDLASTEIYKNNGWSILHSAALPSPTRNFSAGKIDNTIFVIGKNVNLR